MSDEIKAQAAAVAEATTSAQEMWDMLVDIADEEDTKRLAESMSDVLNDAMHDQRNAEATLALVSFVASYVSTIAERADISEFEAFVMFQIGLQRSMAGMIAINRALAEKADVGLQS